MPTSEKLVSLIERNALELTRQWLRIVRSDPGTPSYHSYDEQILCERAQNVYSLLGEWISREISQEEIAVTFTSLGAQQHAEGFSLAEIIMALIISRRVLWAKVQEDGVLDSGLDIHMARGLHNRLTQFFDRATYFIINGYEQKITSAQG